MTAVQTVIDRFGGVRKMARAMGRGASTVQGWKEAGFIPSQRIPEVIAAGRGLGIALTPADFFDVEPARGASAEAA